MNARTPIALSGASDRAAERLLRADRHIREAFEGLDLGWTLEDVEEWLEGTPSQSGQRLPIWNKIPEELRGQLVGMVMAFGILVVERDREP